MLPTFIPSPSNHPALLGRRSPEQNPESGSDQAARPVQQPSGDVLGGEPPCLPVCRPCLRLRGFMQPPQDALQEVLDSQAGLLANGVKG